MRKIKGRKRKDLTINEGTIEDVGELMGAFAGDGCFCVDKLNRGTLKFTIGAHEKQYIKRIKYLLTNVYNGRKPACYLKHDKSCYDVLLYSR